MEIVSGANHHCVRFADGSVKCWGYNGTGQLGIGDTTNRGTSQDQMGSALPTVDLGTGQRAISIVATTNHTCVILQDGAVKCWGFNPDGRLGLEDTTNRGDKPGQMGDALPTLKLGTGRTAKSLALSTAGGCALLDNDTLKCWGQNSFGQLGQENIIAMGDKPGSMGDQLPTVNLGQGRTVKAIASGDFSYCALLDNATVKCWGRNHLGQLGIEDLVNRGDDPGEMGDALPSINLGGSLALKQIAASGIGAMCAMVGNVNGYVGLKCWGGNPSGGLGLGDTMNRGGTSASMGDMLPLIDLGVNTIPATFRTGGRTCVQFSDGTLKCWGGNARGQLGLGDINNRGDIPGEMGAALPVIDLGQGKRVKAFAMGGVSTCAIVTGNIVKCWGGNDSGALGLGVASANDDRGDAPNEMGDKLPAVDLW